MKDETKFRGLRVDGGGWVYGFYIESSSEHHLGKRSLIVCGDRSTTYAGKDFIEVHPETVGQFTGLKDKNDVDIYEGDVLTNIRGGTWTVQFKLYSYAAFFELHDWDRKELEVTGNIHENKTKN